MLPAIKNCNVLSALLNTFDHVYKKINYTKLKKKKKIIPSAERSEKWQQMLSGSAKRDGLTVKMHC